MIGSGCYYLISDRSRYYFGMLSRRHRSRDYYIIIYGTRHQMRDGVGRYYFIIYFRHVSAHVARDESMIIDVRTY